MTGGGSSVTGGTGAPRPHPHPNNDRNSATRIFSTEHLHQKLHTDRGASRAQTPELLITTQGPLFKPTRYGGTSERKPAFGQHTLRRHLALALACCSLPPLTWYQCTRHSFASRWVLAGGSLEKLAAVMGHSSVVVTERYAHLKPDLFREEDYELLDIDLLKPAGEVVPMPTGRAENGTVGYAVVTQADREAGGVPRSA